MRGKWRYIQGQQRAYSIGPMQSWKKKFTKVHLMQRRAYHPWIPSTHHRHRPPHRHCWCHICFQLVRVWVCECTRTTGCSETHTFHPVPPYSCRRVWCLLDAERCPRRPDKKEGFKTIMKIVLLLFSKTMPRGPDQYVRWLIRRETHTRFGALSLSHTCTGGISWYS